MTRHNVCACCSEFSLPVHGKMLCFPKLASLWYLLRLANQSRKKKLIISAAIVIDNRLVITKDLVIILPI